MTESPLLRTGNQENPPAGARKLRERLIVHPFLFALWPVVALALYNLGQFPLPSMARPALVVTLGTLLLWLVLWGAVRSLPKAGLMCSLLVVASFSYGPLRSFPTPFLLPACLLLVLYVLFFTVRWKKDFRPLTYIAHWTSATLIFLPLAEGVFTGAFRNSLRWTPASLSASFPGIPSLFPGTSKPDIYCIVLDGYGRADILATRYGYDNRPFLERMKRRGFFVAEHSRANYSQTLLSFASLLNMDYLQELTSLAGTDSQDRRDLWALLRNNRVFQLMEQQGYQVRAWETGYHTNLPHVEGGGIFYMNELERELFQRTCFPDLIHCFTGQDLPVYQHRKIFGENVTFGLSKSI